MAAEIPDGAVIVARAVLNSSLWTMRAQDRILAITCICMANWKERRWFDGRESISLSPGQFVTSTEKLAEAARLSAQETRTSLKHLEKAGFLTRKATRHWTLITLPKYGHYQNLSKYYNTDINIRPTHPQQTPNEPLTNGQPTPNNKQEGEEGEKREEGEEATAPSLGCKRCGNLSMVSVLAHDRDGNAYDAMEPCPECHPLGKKARRAK